LPLEGSPFSVQRELEKWEAGGGPLRAGISSFGAGGANAHVVVEEAPAPMPRKSSQQSGPQAIVLSARSVSQIRQQATALHDHWSVHPELLLEDVAFTLQCGREAMAARAGFIAVDRDAALSGLSALANGKTPEITNSGDAALAGALQNWLDDAGTDWEALHVGQSVRRVHLPLYPFDRSSFWAPSKRAYAELSRDAKSNVIDSNRTEQSDSTVLLRPSWLAARAGADVAQGDRVVVLCGFNEPLAETLRLALEPLEAVVVPSGAFVDQARRVLAAVQSRLRTAPVPRLVQFVAPSNAPPTLHAALAALAGSLMQEAAPMRAQAIALTTDLDADVLVEKLRQDATSLDSVIRDDVGGRAVRGIDEVALRTATATNVWRDGGIYLISGGMGGLGRIFAHAIARAVRNPVLILLGRTSLNDERHAALAELKALGATVRYLALDVSDRTAVASMVADVRREFGRGVNGVLHSAGVLKDGYLATKDLEQALTVLSTKVEGALSLDAATTNEPLDVFACFSSISGFTGNAGQTDYACANGWLDGFAAWRNQLTSSGMRQGRTLSVNWPYWEDGGMHVSPQGLAAMREGYGLAPMPSEDGVDAFAMALESGLDQVIVAYGDRAKILERLAGGVKTYAPDGVVDEMTEEREKTSSISSEGSSRDSILFELRKAVAEIMRLSPEEVSVDEQLSDFGFDSISFSDLAQLCSNRFGVEVAPTIFFSGGTLNEVSEQLDELWKRNATVTAGSTLKHARPLNHKPKTGQVSEPAIVAANDLEPVAIVGVSGVLPKAQDLETLWANLMEGRDGVSEIPLDRWDWRALWGDPRLEPGRSDVKWGGFMEGLDEFDPLFFGISLREAELMDPLQRLLITHCWRAVEDSGHAPSSLSGSLTAVYLASCRSDYGLLAASQGIVLDEMSPTGSVPCMGPNRVSYLLNLRGPSEPIETACSSSMVALHRGVEAIRHGGCDMALVGGVNVVLTPSGHISFSRAGMLSPDGRCKAFSADANGYVRSEGVGVLMLKRLSLAEADGDRIYGVVRNSGVNHGGRGTSVTAPTAKSQAELIERVIAETGVDPRTINCIEAHGTGTRLGDPVEIDGLQMAFRHLYERAGVPVEPESCGIGSIKSFVGHMEMAAGVGAVFKALLQLKHQTLIGNLHCEEINPMINLSGSPFYILRQNRHWDAPREADGSVAPRRASISSFGYGGVNAALLLEEYVPLKPVDPVVGNGPELVLLSARSEPLLREAASNLLKWIETVSDDEKDPAVRFSAMTYTLQVGRDAQPARLAFVANNLDETAKTLRSWLAGNASMSVVRQGMWRRKRGAAAPASPPADARLETLRDAWVDGAGIDFSKRWGDTHPQRLHLPPTPLARDRYWFTNVKKAASPVSTVDAPQLEMPMSAPRTPSSDIHPLLDRNSDVAGEVSYSCRLKQSAPILRDHIVAGVPVMPGTGYLELALAAASDFTQGRHGRHLEKVVFQRMAQPNEDGLTLQVRLMPGAQDRLDFEVYSEVDGIRTVHARGISRADDHASPAPFDIDALRSASTQSIDKEDFYSVFDAVGLKYGPSHRGIQHAFMSGDVMVAALVLPDQAPRDGRYILHPSITDAAFQVLLGFDIIGDNLNSKGFAVPALLDGVDVSAQLPERLWAVVKRQQGGYRQRYDITLCDERGAVCAQLHGLGLAAVRSDTSNATTLLMEPTWEDRPLRPHSIADGHSVAKRQVLVSERIAAARSLRVRDAQLTILNAPQDHTVDTVLANHLRSAIEVLRPKAPNRLQVIVPYDGEDGLLEALSGFVRTATTELADLKAQLIAVPRAISADVLADIIDRE
ncbi:MAG TPA: SDR family NAD(P)-dependent oxidoreductase, partial [Magnetovibrio sp.]